MLGLFPRRPLLLTFKFFQLESEFPIWRQPSVSLMAPLQKPKSDITKIVSIDLIERSFECVVLNKVHFDKDGMETDHSG